MSRGFLVCNYNSLLPLFRLLDCLDFVPKTPFCLVSVPFRHLPIIVQRLPCFLAGQCVLGSSHPSQPRDILLCREFVPFSGEGGRVCVTSGSLSPDPFVGNIHTPPSFSVSLNLFLSCLPLLTSSLSSLLPLFLPV